jgi:hypothetical protein
MIAGDLIGSVESSHFTAPIIPPIFPTVFATLKPALFPTVRTAILLSHIAGLSDTGVIAATAGIPTNSTAVERTRPTIQRTRAAVQ